MNVTFPWPDSVATGSRSGTVTDVCTGTCVQCGAADRLFVQTDIGIVSCCYQCGDETLLDRRPQFCRARYNHDH